MRPSCAPSRRPDGPGPDALASGGDDGRRTLREDDGQARPAPGGGLKRRESWMHRTFEHDGVSDHVAIEEPLEIRVDGSPLAVTMRTPGSDEELALGFLYGEGLIDGARKTGPTADFAANIIDVAGPLTRDPGARRFYTTSSCGVCGKGALEEVAVASARLPDGPRLDRALAAELPARLEQPGFQLTGGLHATGLFDPDGELLFTREDVGRHNAMDKVVGRALLDGLVPLGERVLCVSGRLSFELVQKCAVAGAPILIGVGAPSSLAIELAADRGLTLCGFARRGSINVYTRPERVLG
jgi:FdhD protein